MLPDVNLIPGSVSEMLAMARQTGRLKKADQYGLMAAVLEESLSDEEARAVNRLLRSVQRGKVKIIDEL